MIVLIDNYDSFTFNLVHYLGDLGAAVRVHRNDKVTVGAVIAADPDAIVFSPGPCTPKRPGFASTLSPKHPAAFPSWVSAWGIRRSGTSFGGKVVRAPTPAHGKLSNRPACRRRHLPGHQWPLPGDPLSFLGRGAAKPARRSYRHCRYRGRADHRPVASAAAGAWRAIPSREHRVGTRPSYAEELSRHRCVLERIDRRGGDQFRRSSTDTN